MCTTKHAVECLVGIVAQSPELLPVTGEGRSTNGLLTLTYYAAADGKEEEIAAQ